MRKLAWAVLAAVILASPAQAQKTKTQLGTELGQQLPDNNAGGVTPAILRQVLTDFYNSWQQYSGVNPQTGTSYTIQLSDYGQLVTFNNAGSVAVTLPAPTGSFSIFNFYVRATGAGTATITPQGGATINGAASLAVASGQAAWVISDGVNYQTWLNPSLVISCSGMPALTGDVTTSLGSCVTTLTTAQPAAHTWALAQTFTTAPVFTDQSGSRTALGLGTAATQNTGTSGATVPFLNGVNTWASAQTFTTAPVFTDQAGSRTALGLGTAATQNTGTSGANLPFLNGNNTWGGTNGFAAVTATTFNKLTLTQPATGSTLTIADGKTVTHSATQTFAGTDGKTLTLTNGLTVSGNDGTLSFGAASKTLTVNNSLAFSGTDGSTYTMPGSSATIPQVVASGTLALSTGAITSATCVDNTATATNALTSDALEITFASDPTGVTGYAPSTGGSLWMAPWFAAGVLHVKQCNPSSGSITPSALSLNWRLVR